MAELHCNEDRDQVYALRLQVCINIEDICDTFYIQIIIISKIYISS